LNDLEVVFRILDHITRVLRLCLLDGR
jgi:hypothetical protein